MKFIIGKKVEMTQQFAENGNVVPVTVVQAGPCRITQTKTEISDGYESIQLGYDEMKKVNKPRSGHLKGIENYRTLREFRLPECTTLKRGDTITVSAFEVGDTVTVVGTSKGKGFQGVVKRHGFHGSPATHGHKDQHRMPGSIGATDAARVFKGTRMGGQMGSDRVSVANLTIEGIDTEKNLLYIKGAIPGARNSIVLISGEGEITLEEKSKKEASKEESKEAPVTEEESSSRDSTTEGGDKEGSKKADEKIGEKKDNAEAK